MGVLIVAGSVAVALAAGEASAQAPPGVPIRVCIDAGHGGSATGATGFGYLEKDLNLDMALRLRDLLAADTADHLGGGEWDVLMTRSTDVFVSLGQRVQVANAWPAERFVSIHCNAFSNPAANGTETYAFAEGTTAAGLRDEIHDEMLQAWGLVDRGTKTANFYVLVNTTMPASLSEVGFITSPIDIVKLADPLARQDMARAHLFGLQRHFGMTPYDPGGPPSTYCTAKTTSGGCVPVITFIGNPTLSGPDDFHVTAHTLMGGQFGMLVWALQPGSQPFFGGTLCIGWPFVRTPVQNSGGAGCLGTFDYHFTQALMTQHGLGVGTGVFAQYWFRDPGFPPPNNIGLTGGLAFWIAP